MSRPSLDTIGENTRRHIHGLVRRYLAQSPRPPYVARRGAQLWRDEVLAAVRRGQEHRSLAYRIPVPDRRARGRWDHRSMEVVCLLHPALTADVAWLDVRTREDWSEHERLEIPPAWPGAAQLYRVRVRDLRLADGSPISTREHLTVLLEQYGLKALPEVPDDLSSLVDAPAPVVEPPVAPRSSAGEGAALMTRDEAVLWHRLACAALYPTHDGQRACCRGRGERELSRVHAEVHEYVDRAAPREPEAREVHRRLLLRELHHLIGRRGERG